MDEERKFIERLISLRNKENVSARDMSLSLDQNPAYINNIENGKALPSMSAFFSICKYLEITPTEFFNYSNNNPKGTNEITNLLNRLSKKQCDDIINIINDIIK